MAQRVFRAPILTDGAGAATVMVPGVLGVIHAVSVLLDDGASPSLPLASGVGFTITDEATGAAVITLTNVTVKGRYMPRVPVHDGTGAVITGAYTAPPVCGRVKIVVASGGASKRGVVLLHAETEGVY